MYALRFRQLFYFHFVIILLSLISPTLCQASLNASVLEQLKNEDVVDTTHTLTSVEVNQLKQQNEQLYQQRNIDFKILMIPSTQGESIEKYALDVFNTLKIGDGKLDNGLLLLVSQDDRQIRFEVGYGLEGDITDIEAGHLIRYQLAPHFKEYNYFKGLSDVQQKLINNPDTDSLPIESNQIETLDTAEEESPIPLIQQPPETDTANVVYLNKPSKFISNYILVLFWNIAVSSIIVIYFSPIYSQIREQNLKIKGLIKFLVVFLPLHHFFCWAITGINFFLLFPIYAAILYLLFQLNKKWNIYEFSHQIYNKYLGKNLKVIIIIGFILFIFLMFFIDSHFISIFITLLFMPFILGLVWAGIYHIAKQFKQLYPEKYQHWFDESPITSRRYSSSSSSSSTSSRSSSSRSSGSSRRSGGSSGGGGASGSW